MSTSATIATEGFGCPQLQSNSIAATGHQCIDAIQVTALRPGVEVWEGLAQGGYEGLASAVWEALAPLVFERGLVAGLDYTGRTTLVDWEGKVTL